MDERAGHYLLAALFPLQMKGLNLPDIRLDQFDHTLIASPKPKWMRAMWMLTAWAFLDTAFPWPSRIKCCALRLFGAKIGRGVCFRSRVYIHSPWNLEIGDHCWIGDGTQLLSIEKIVLETQVALAHGVYLAAGSHNIHSATMAPANQPITVCSGSWIASRAFIGPGVTVGQNCVIGAAAVVTRDVADSTVAVGSPAHKVAERVIDQP